MKKGFTLVELLGVITIIAILSLLVIPQIVAFVKSGGDDAYDEQMASLKASLKNWGAANTFNLPVESGGKIQIKLGCLKREGFVEVGIKNPQTGKCFCNDATFTITRSQNSYIYEIDETVLNKTGGECSSTVEKTCEIANVGTFCD